ncbi:MAG: 50S ribosomal protein L32 [Myxococcaceae bacterium]|nr:50S ribosomal protein L32 [Myxococcaceae bacterium]MBH2005912.1 50S ribosomal protein L32 [Myxococcaceae bacterium]
MAVPYGRKSRTRSRIQRAANMRYTAKGHSVCSHCGEPKLAHHICNKCGQYAGRQVFEIQTEN